MGCGADPRAEPRVQGWGRLGTQRPQRGRLAGHPHTVLGHLPAGSGVLGSEQRLLDILVASPFLTRMLGGASGAGVKESDGPWPQVTPGLHCRGRAAVSWRAWDRRRPERKGAARTEAGLQQDLQGHPSPPVTWTLESAAAVVAIAGAKVGLAAGYEEAQGWPEAGRGDDQLRGQGLCWPLPRTPAHGEATATSCRDSDRPPFAVAFLPAGTASCRFLSSPVCVSPTGCTSGAPDQSQPTHRPVPLWSVAARLAGPSLLPWDSPTCFLSWP